MTNGEECAFIVPASMHQDPSYGLTKREYFAAMAMQGLMFNYDINVNDEKQCHERAIAAVIAADQLIQSLNKI